VGLQWWDYSGGTTVVGKRQIIDKETLDAT
jgi:hypothetical protein